jgi:hypothetical protein
MVPIGAKAGKPAKSEASGGPRQRIGINVAVIQSEAKDPRRIAAANDRTTKDD